MGRTSECPEIWRVELPGVPTRDQNRVTTWVFSVLRGGQIAAGHFQHLYYAEYLKSSWVSEKYNSSYMYHQSIIIFY